MKSLFINHHGFFPGIVVLVMLLTLSSCDTTQPDLNSSPELRIQMQVISESEAMKSSLSSAQNNLTIEEVKLYIDEMELEGENIELEVRNFIVNLPLDGSPFVIAEQLAPEGVYNEFELEIEKPDDDVEVDDRDFRDETGSYSVVVKGLYDGEEFTFRSSEDFEIDIDLDPPMVISDAEDETLTIGVDITSWFKGKDGETLDPKDFQNTETINNNIEQSFEIFEDYYDN